MLENASIRFYKVKSCGFFRPNARNCTLGSYSEILNNVYNWASESGRLIQNTCTYEVDEDFDMEFLETYLVSAKRSANGDMLFAFWNRTHSSGNSTYALDVGTQLGNVSEDTFHQGDLPEASIPGFATYFWFLPSENVMATLTFGSPRSGMNAFSYWLENFMKTESRYASFNSANEFLGYMSSSGTIYNDLEPRFRKSLYKNPSKRDMIITNRDQIRGVVRRVNLDRVQVDDQDIFDRLCGYIGMNSDAEVNEHEVSLKYEFNYTPSETQLSEILQSYEESDNRTNWEDVGFLFPDNNGFGANNKEWLSKSFAKTKLSIDIEWVLTGQLVNSQVLLTAIQTQRDYLVNLLTVEEVEELRSAS